MKQKLRTSNYGKSALAFAEVEHSFHNEGRDKAAFTLAEVMIVVAIIGVVAALVMPTFIKDMAERINSHKQANIAQKITKSVELMIVNGEYESIYSTEDLVDRLSKYLKIAKRCDSDHLTDCWPTKKIKTTLGKEYNVEDAKTAADLHSGKDNTTPNVGLVLADGTSLIMTFNPEATPILSEAGFTATTKDLPIGNKKTQSFAYTSNATDAIDFVMDVNGKTGPNQEYNTLKDEYYDIRSFKAAVFDGCAGTRIPDIGCVINLNKTATWENAKKACSDIGMKLPDLGSLKSIYNKKSEYFKNGWILSSSEQNANGVYTVNENGDSPGVSKNGTYKFLCLGN